MLHRLSWFVALPLFAGCGVSEFAAQCDGLTDQDAQIACLDDGFQSLRSQHADCLGDDVGDRMDDCYTRCYDSRRLTDEECRLACVDDREDDRVDETRTDDREADRTEPTRTDDREADRTDEDRVDDRDCERERYADPECVDERSRQDLDDLHVETRDTVSRTDRAADREITIRDGLRDGEDLARCDRGRDERGR